MANVFEAVVAYALFITFFLLLVAGMVGYCLGWNDPAAPIKHVTRLTNEALSEMDGLNSNQDEESGDVKSSRNRKGVELTGRQSGGKGKFEKMDSFGKEGEISGMTTPMSGQSDNASTSTYSTSAPQTSVVSPLKERAIVNEIEAYSAFEEPAPVKKATTPNPIKKVPSQKTEVVPTPSPSTTTTKLTTTTTPSSSMKNKIKQRKIEDEEKKKKKKAEEEEAAKKVAPQPEQGGGGVAEEAGGAGSGESSTLQEEGKRGDDLITDATSVQSTNSGPGATKKRPSKVKPKKKKQDTRCDTIHDETMTP
jgi:hypothetical protein